ncbi:UDP-2,3-diacylglucosamine diphosphatase [Caulobacter sp. KR2-114]|uniref:UDP-2,3-diacylglucosamine diphosphatase n=1 Tax=Caulobacter sp. KR2-114 TaxID=3400912 RepID=UPI003C0A90CB
MAAEDASARYRTVFISDVHLGTRGCQAELLLDFIRHVACDRLYLVGDIVDGWKLRSGWHWPQAHNDVVQKVLRLARKGVEVIYVPGNHDDRIRDFCGVHFGGVIVARDMIHQAADGRRYLVMHGDEFDGVVQYAPWLAFVGDWAYRTILMLNTLVNRVRRRLGFGYWSLSAFLKVKVKNALQFIEDFESAVAAEARRRGVDGVICGHIHKAEMRDIEGVTYINDGDWVESCTALVEHFDGRMEILHWAKQRSWSMIDRARRVSGVEIESPEPSLA